MTSRREAELLAIIEQQKEELARKDQEIKLLNQKVDLLVRRIFGSSSEKLSEGQLDLGLEGLLGKADPSRSLAEKIAEGEKSLEANRRKEPRERRPRLPEHLPVEEERIVPLEVQADPKRWRQIGEEVTEQLDYRPAVYLRRRIVRPKYTSIRNRDQVPLMAPLPPMLQERCLAAPGMLSHVVVSKYADHLPLYRQEQILQRRFGIPITRQTLDDWVMLVAFWMKPIYDLIKTTVMEGRYLQADETPIRYLDPGNGKARQGYFWTVSQPGGSTVFHWYPGRGEEGLKDVLPPDYVGVVQSDGYPVYKAYADENPIELAGCWAHARRKFFEAQEQDWRMGWVLRQIGHLYRIERELRRIGAGPILREAVRQWQARPIVERVGAALERWQASHRFLPMSGADKAAEYTLRRLAQLKVYLSDGRIEIDNNHVENAIRPTAIGKKNWLFIGAEKAGMASAILFTIIEECRHLGLNPEIYLAEALKRLPTATNRTVHRLTPAALSPCLASSKLRTLKAA